MWAPGACRRVKARGGRGYRATSKVGVLRAFAPSTDVQADVGGARRSDIHEGAAVKAGAGRARDFPDIHSASPAEAGRHEAVYGCSHSHQRRRNAPCRTPGCHLSPALGPNMVPLGPLLARSTNRGGPAPGLLGQCQPLLPALALHPGVVRPLGPVVWWRIQAQVSGRCRPNVGFAVAPGVATVPGIGQGRRQRRVSGRARKPPWFRPRGPGEEDKRRAGARLFGRPAGRGGRRGDGRRVHGGCKMGIHVAPLFQGCGRLLVPTDRGPWPRPRSGARWHSRPPVRVEQ
jgi:hypothetical protein